jgi:chromatin structure-remodeling complex subunit RSC1/2
MTRAGYNFASISAGPGNERALAAASATIDARDRDFLDQISYKGSLYHVGDYVHLANPDDTNKPIVGQIYKLFVPRRFVDRFAIFWRAD